MSGAAAGRVLVFDPERRLDPAQYHGNVVCEIGRRGLALPGGSVPRRRGAPPRRCRCASKATSSCCVCEGEWRRFRYDEAFLQLIPQKVARKLAKRGVTPPQLEQLVGE